LYITFTLTFSQQQPAGDYADNNTPPSTSPATTPMKHISNPADEVMKDIEMPKPFQL
jgi:hypothetical protein